MRTRVLAMAGIGFLSFTSGCSTTDSTAPLEAVATVSIVAPKTELVVGQQLQLAAKPLNSTGSLITGRSAVWTSTNQGVANVNASGVVTAIAPGVATINAVSGEATGSVSIKVFGVAIASITIAPLQSPVAAATHVTLVPTAKDSSGTSLTGRSFTWSSSDSIVARVSQAGVVTGLAPGSTTITAAQDGKSATVVVNVVAGAAASISIGNTGKVFVQGTRQLTVIARDVLGNLIANPTMSWTSSDGSSVSVNSTGLITGLKSGNDVTITATSASAAGATTTRALAIVSMGGGDEQNCALADTGEVQCWGVNTGGQLGAGPLGSDTSFVPLSVVGGLRFASLSVGASHSCALTADGIAYCWGAGESGQIGDGSRSARSTPVKVAGTVRFSKISAGRYHTCGIATDGDVYCWGGSTFNFSSSTTLTPAKVTSTVQMKVISSGENQTCGLDSTGTLYCWSGSSATGFQPIATDQRFVSLSITRGTRCALTADGKVYCWGFNAFTKSSNGLPIEVLTSVRFKSIATAVDRLCGVTFDASAYCIGTGFLGDGSNHFPSTSDFVNVSPGVSNVTQFAFLAPGLFSTCGATPAGTPFCWGLGSRIGIGFSATQFSPVMVAAPQ